MMISLQVRVPHLRSLTKNSRPNGANHVILLERLRQVNGSLDPPSRRFADLRYGIYQSIYSLFHAHQHGLNSPPIKVAVTAFIKPFTRDKGDPIKVFMTHYAHIPGAY